MPSLASPGGGAQSKETYRPPSTVSSSIDALADDDLSTCLRSMLAEFERPLEQLNRKDAPAPQRVAPIPADPYGAAFLDRMIDGAVARDPGAWPLAGLAHRPGLPSLRRPR